MREHDTSLPSQCWCKPRMIVEGDTIITIHRCPDCGRTQCICDENENKNENENESIRTGS